MIFGKKKEYKKNISERIKDNLLDINFADPAIYTNGKASLFLDLKPFLDNKTFHNFLWGKEEELTLSNKDILADIIEQLQRAEYMGDIFDLCNQYGLEVTPKDSATWKGDLDKARKAVEAKAKKATIKLDSIIKKLNKTVKDIETNESIYSLYIGSYFLQGMLDKEDKFINAPLLLWEVEAKIQDGKAILTKKQDYLSINSKINFYLKQKVKDEFSFSDTPTREDVISYELKLRNIGMVKFNQDEIVRFELPTSKTFSILNACGLMIVEPTGSVISQDIIKMQKDKGDPFKINTSTKNNIVYKEKVIKKDDVIEINRKLNIYQKYAIESSLAESSLIYGPPGTGKSETITSLIANILYNGNTILISSEKQDALEVIDERLGRLNKLVLTGYTRDENLFYDKLIELERAIRQTTPPTKYKPSKDAYFDLVATNDLINRFYEPKYFDSKQQKLFTQFSTNVGAIDAELYNEIINLKIFEYFDEIMKKQSVDFNGAIKFINEFRSRTEPYSKELEVLKNHQTFNSYDKGDLTKFLSNYENNSDADLMLSNLIMKNKVSGKSVFATKAILVDQDHNAFKALFQTLIDLGLNNLSREAIQTILIFNYDANNFKMMYDYHWWIENLASEKLFKKPTMEQLRNAYSRERDSNIEYNDNVLYNLFLNEIVSKVNKLKEEQSQKMFAIFSIAKQKKRPNVNAFIKANYEALRFFYPVWMLTPEQTCITCPIKKDLFDYGIFDEASQMFVEKSYPLVYRCKTRIVAGDNKQLQPSNFFTMRASVNDETLLTEATSESLFEAAESCLWSEFYLKNHYRSINGELIAFSNKYFYNNELQYSNYNGNNQCPISIYDVKGQWEDNCNEVEIKKVIDILKDNERAFADKKVIVVTFNVIQRDMLESEFVNKLSNTKLAKSYHEKRLIFKSLENVQGTEADVVILSMSYGPNEKGTVRQFFGPLSQPNGINRLNVAITRAKEHMIVVKSMKHEDIKLSDNKNNNIFKDYLIYLDTIAKQKTNDFIINEPKDLPIGLEQYINAELTQKGCRVISNYQIGNKVLDVAVVNESTSQVVLGLIINNNTTPTSTMELVEILDGLQFLHDLGYNVYYLNAVDWYVRPDEVKKELYNKVLGL